MHQIEEVVMIVITSTITWKKSQNESMLIFQLFRFRAILIFVVGYFLLAIFSKHT